MKERQDTNLERQEILYITSLCNNRKLCNQVTERWWQGTFTITSY